MTSDKWKMLMRSAKMQMKRVHGDAFERNREGSPEKGERFFVISTKHPEICSLIYCILDEKGARGGNNMARKIVVTSGKGGVGKTTVTANLGVQLAKNGCRVVVCDLDFGLNNVDVVLGVENLASFDVIDAIEGRCRPKQALVKHPHYPTLYSLASNRISERYVSPQAVTTSSSIPRRASTRGSIAPLPVRRRRCSSRRRTSRRCGTPTVWGICSRGIG